VILTNETLAKKLTIKPVYVLGCASATDFLNFPGREDLTHFVASRIAMKNAMKMAVINLWDIQIAELYDQSTMMEIVAMEDLGFCEEGTAWQCLRGRCETYDGYYEVNGKKLFVNTNGGLKADGNPLGATGGAQVFEVFRQLRGEAGSRQVRNDEAAPKYGCTQEFEGFGTKGYVTILGRD